MIRITLYQNKNKKNEAAYGKWYPRPVIEETIGLEELAAHMASHNTPFSQGAIKGMLTDAVICTKELLLLGKNVKFPDLAIFSIGLRVKSGAKSEEDFSIAKNIEGVRLRARATGNLTSASLSLDATLKRVNGNAATSSDNAGSSSSGSSGSSGSGSTTGGGSSAGDGNTSIQ